MTGHRRLPGRAMVRWATLGAATVLPPGLMLVGLVAVLVSAVEPGAHPARNVSFAIGMGFVAILGSVVLYAGV